MKFSRYIGDMSIDLEGEPEEIIEVLEYIDKNRDELVVDEKELVEYIKKRLGQKGYGISIGLINEILDLELEYLDSEKQKSQKEG